LAQGEGNSDAKIVEVNADLDGKGRMFDEVITRAIKTQRQKKTLCMKAEHKQTMRIMISDTIS
jgi:hypothetical protein